MHLHMHAHVVKAHTDTHPHRHKHACTGPQRPLRCLAVGAGVVSFNDGEASAGEASLSSILSRVFAQSAHQRDTDVGHRRGKRGTFKSQRWAEKKSAAVVAFGWKAAWLHSRNGGSENRSQLKEKGIVTSDYIRPMYYWTQERFHRMCLYFDALFQPSFVWMVHHTSLCHLCHLSL